MGSNVAEDFFWDNFTEADLYVLVKPNCLHFVLTANRTFATVPSQKSLIPIIIKANHWRPNLTVE